MTRLDVLQELSNVQAALKDMRATRGADGKFADPLTQVSLDKNNARYLELSSLLTDLNIEEEQRKLQVEREVTTRDNADSGREKPNLSYDASFWRWATQSMENPNLSADEKRMLSTRAASEVRGTSINIGSTDSLGGYAIPQEFSNEIESMMKWYGGYQAFGKWDSNAGGSMKYPSIDDTATTGNIPGQGTASTVADLTLGQILFGDYTIDSKIIKVSDELDNDNGVGLIKEILRDFLPSRLGRAVNTYLTNGTGTSQPYGFTTTVTNSALTTAGATAITQAELMRVMYSVDRAYRQSPGTAWMVSDTIMGYLRTLELGNTNTVPIFTPNLDVVGAEPVKLFGYPIYINNDLAAAHATTRLPVTATKSVYFGDFNKYKVRSIGGVNMSRNDQLYWAERSIGFRGYVRKDGNLVNANAIKYLLQA